MLDSAAELEPTQQPSDAIVSLGFDPAQIRALVLTATSVVAVSADYPEPPTQPEEAP